MVETLENHKRFRGRPSSVDVLTRLGRVRLSKSFYMREFLHSEIAEIYDLPNIPDDPELAIYAGTHLCRLVLEPIQDALGRISVRSGYRSVEVNATGSANNHKCAANEANYAAHIWDRRDDRSSDGRQGFAGATASIVVTSFVDYYEETGDWPALAWWIHDHVPEYAEMCFFPKLAAFNIRWSENPAHSKRIHAHFPNPHTGKKSLLGVGQNEPHGGHQSEYQAWLNYLAEHT